MPCVELVLFGNHPASGDEIHLLTVVCVFTNTALEVEVTLFLSRRRFSPGAELPDLLTEVLGKVTFLESCRDQLSMLLPSGVQSQGRDGYMTFRNFSR